MVSKPSRAEVSAVLNAAHGDIYRGRPRGEAWVERVHAATPEIEKLRTRAIHAYQESQRRKVTNRSDAKRAYAVAKALFSV
jgi:hypothetical protein